VCVCVYVWGECVCGSVYIYIYSGKRFCFVRTMHTHTHTHTHTPERIDIAICMGINTDSKPSKIGVKAEAGINTMGGKSSIKAMLE